MPTPQFASVTAEKLAITQLVDCEAELRTAKLDPVRVLFAAKSLHGALVASLTAALAGSAGVGAYGKSLQVEWREFLNSDREEVTTIELPNRVMSPNRLLDRACESGGIEWRSEPLSCSPEERALFERLTFVRDNLEHPKPAFHSFEIAWVLEPFPVAVRLTLQALEAVGHHLEEGEMRRLRDVGHSLLAEAEKWGKPVYG